MSVGATTNDAINTNEVSKPKPKPTYPRWIVIYYIHTPGSAWLGKGVEFFDDEAPARKRGRETNGTSRPFYPPWDRQYLGAAQGYAAPVSLTDYFQERAS
jgi:hypothetical protein